MAQKHLRFALFGNVFQARKSMAVQKLFCILDERKASILIDGEFHRYLTDTLHLDIRPEGLIENDDFSADFVISMGGDGTFLEAAKRVGHKGIPILGINTGRLGFMADVLPDEIEAMVTALYQGEYDIEQRTVIQVATEGAPLQTYPYALNEVAVLKRDDSSMISIRTNVDGEFLAQYQADGLIVSTPTGSTGYALSVGGPIMSPQSSSFALTPVAPHSLTVRPIVLSDDTEIRLTVDSRNHQFLVAVDGRSETCPEDTVLILRKAPYKTCFVKRRGQSYFNTLRQKLMWGADKFRVGE